MARAPQPDDPVDDGDRSPTGGNGLLGGPIVFVIFGAILLLVIALALSAFM
ncbi:MAG: hypothetical protein ACO1OK_07945 [Devosia sp.]